MAGEREGAPLAVGERGTSIQSSARSVDDGVEVTQHGEERRQRPAAAVEMQKLRRLNDE